VTAVRGKFKRLSGHHIFWLGLTEYISLSSIQQQFINSRDNIFIQYNLLLALGEAKERVMRKAD
jgi:hypothetical protein